MNSRRALSVGLLSACLSVASGALLSGCSSGSSGDDSEPESETVERVSLTGLAQKGPFSQLQIHAREIKNGQPGPRLPVEVSGQRFSVEVDKDALVELEAEGTFTNELTGKPVVLQPALTAFANADGTPQNINILTSLIAARFRHWQASGQSGDAGQQLRQFEREFMQAAGLGEDTDPGQLDLADIPADANLDNGNLELLLMSAGLLEFDAPDGKMPPAYQQMLDALQKGAEPGDILPSLTGLDAAALYQQMKTAAVVKDLPDLRLPDSPVWVCRLGCEWLSTNGMTVSIAGVTVFESQGRAELLVRRAGTDFPALKVGYTTRDGVALSGLDYIATEGSLSFAAGERSKTLTIPLLLDDQSEGKETFTVALSLPDDATDVSLSQSQAVVSILDGAPDVAALPGADLSRMSMCFGAVENTATVISETPECHSGPLTPAVFPVDETVALSLQLGLSLGCPSLDKCPVSAQDWRVQLALVADSGKTALAAAEIGDTSLTLGEYLYPASSLTLDDALPERVLVSLNQPGIHAFLARAWSLQREVRLQATVVDAPAGLSEPVVTIDTPAPVPVASAVQFGDDTLYLDSSTITSPDSSALSCSDDAVAVGGTFSYRLEQQGVTAAVIPLSGEVCLTVSADAQGALQATTRSGELVASQLVYPLPEWHFFTLEKRGLDNIWEAATTRLPYMVMTSSLPASQYRLWVGAEHLPFMYRIAGAKFGAQGLTLDYSARRLVTEVDRHPDDPLKAHINSNAAPLSSSGSGTLLMSASGIQDTPVFAADMAMTGWPRGSLSWNSFGGTVQDGEFSGAAVTGLRFSLAQSERCTSSGCVASGVATHTVAGDGYLAANGQLQATTQVRTSSGVGWGNRNDGSLTWQRPDDLAVQDEAVLTLPGVSLAASTSQLVNASGNQGLNAVDSLLAHYEGTTEHIAGSVATRLGNHFPAGISVGPQWYSDQNGQPEQGNGQLLAGKRLQLHMANETLSLNGHDASKYVLRNAGLTGVFNVDPDNLPDVFELMGYPFEFERFSVRLVDNTLDDYNWIDGRIELAGDAGFPMAFESLALDCSGRFGRARTLLDACGDGCRLAGWRADTRLYGMQLVDNGNAAACEAPQQTLQLSQEADFKALDKPLLLDVQWSGSGDMLWSQVRIQDQYLLDSRDGQPGFALAVNQGQLDPIQSLSSPETLRYGTLSLSGQVGVPFWDAMASDLRLANTLDLGDTVAEPAVVVPVGSLLGDSPTLTDSDRQQLNQSLIRDLIDRRSHDLQARYQWGNTGFGFELPVYYDLRTSTDTPSFLGRTLETDLFVLSANAGVDFIEPHRTGLSFGASADFERLSNTRFQIKLGDGEGLARVDDLLVSAGVIDQPVIVPTLGVVDGQVARIEAFANQGFDQLLEDSLMQAVTDLGAAAAPATPNNQDPLVSLSQGMALVRTFPDRLINLMDEKVFDPAHTQLNDTETELRQPLLDIHRDVLAMQAGDSVPNSVRQQLGNARRLVAEGRSRINQPFEQADRLIDQTNAQLAQAQSHLNRIDSARVQVATVLEQATTLVSAQCQQSGVIEREATGYLNSTLTQVGHVRSLLTTLSDNDLLALLVDLVADDPNLNRSLQDAQVQIRQQAREALTRLDEAEQSLRDQLCQGDVNQLLADARDLLTEIGNHSQQIRAGLTDVETEVQRLVDARQQWQQQALEPLAHLDGALVYLDEQLSRGPLSSPGEQLLRIAESGLSDMTLGAINSLVADEAGERDIFDAAFEPLHQQLQTRRDELVAVLDQQLRQRLPDAYLTPEQLRRRLVAALMESAPVRELRQQVNRKLREVTRQTRETLLVLNDKANQAVQAALDDAASEINQVLAEATAPVRDIPLNSARLDGYGVIAGNELERAHIGAEWTMSSATDGEPGNTFAASLDAVSWSANNKAAGCSYPGSGSNLDITISAFNIPASIGESELTLNKVSLGFTLGNGGGDFPLTPLGVSGGLRASGDIAFSEFTVYDPAFAAGIGAQEVYLGAAAGMVFSDIQAEAAFLLGKTCNQDVLMDLDPQVAEFIPLPETGFTGAYIRGSASIPVYSNGCPLTIGAAADMGAWVLAGPPLTLGGLVGGGAYGKVGCVGALRGQIRALGQVNSDGDMTFVGEGFGVAGAGFCSPSSWTSVRRSRKDDWCGTADARFQAGFVNGWSIFDLSASAIH